MFRSLTLLCTTTCLVASVIGCSGSGASNGLIKNDDPSTPDGALVRFLEAVRTGDTTTASSALTPLALQRLHENQMDFAPPASETAQFRVGRVDLFEKNNAFVDSEWIEIDADGKPYEDRMTWKLTHIDGQWRIAGMAAYVEPNRPPLIFDFENPESLVESLSPPSEASPPHSARQPQDPFNPTTSR